MGEQGKGGRAPIDPERVREMAARGMSDPEIAVAIGHPRERYRTIWAIRDRHGIPGRSHEPGTVLVLRRDGKQHERCRQVACARCGRKVMIKCSEIRRGAGRYCSRDCYQPNPPRPEEVEALARSGLTDPEIAAQLGSTDSAVKHVRCRHGISAGSGSRCHTAAFVAGRRIATALALPDWVRPVQLRILNALLHARRPLTANEIRLAIGHRECRGATFGSARIIAGRKTQVNLLGELVSAGLLERIRPSRKGLPRGSRYPSPRFALTPLVLACLVVSGEEAAP